MGDEAHGKEIVNQLDSSNLWRTFFVSSGRQASNLLHTLLDPLQSLLVAVLRSALLSIPTGASGALLPTQVWYYNIAGGCARCLCRCRGMKHNFIMAYKEGLYDHLKIPRQGCCHELGLCSGVEG